MYMPTMKQLKHREHGTSNREFHKLYAKNHMQYYRQLVSRIQAKMYTALYKLCGDDQLLGYNEFSLLEGYLSQVVSLTCGVDVPGRCAGCQMNLCLTPAGCMFNLMQLVLDQFEDLYSINRSDVKHRERVLRVISSLVIVLDEAVHVSHSIPYT